MQQQLIFTTTPAAELDRFVRQTAPAGVWFVVDDNTCRLALPRLLDALPEDSPLLQAHTITVRSGDTNKTVEAACEIWNRLSAVGASRKSLVINLGGGMITDLGGFAAATFKRGIAFVNIPTTLLGAVDAAVGGKTGVNLGGLKNEVGVFRTADAVIISTLWFDTLPEQELKSGYAEMLKHSLLSGTDSLHRHLAFDICTANATSPILAELLAESVRLKERIVTEDPTEQGLRKALNLGHTAGHAFETHAMLAGHPIPHGYAVAYGLIVDLVLSHLLCGMNTEPLHRLAAYVRSHYTPPRMSCDIYDELIGLMRHDKKNISPEAINFSLLRAPGDVALDSTASPEQIGAALDVTRDLIGL